MNPLQASASESAASDRLTRLLGYLAQDPDNQRLLEDVLDTALAQGRFEEARSALARLLALGEPTPVRRYQEGVLLLGEGQAEAASQVLAALWHEGSHHPAVLQAWVQALLAQQAWPALLQALAPWQPEGLPSDQAEFLALAHLRACHALGEFARAERLARQWGAERMLAWPQALGALLSIELDAQEWPQLQAWLSRLDDAVVQAHAEILCARAWMRLLSGAWAAAVQDFQQCVRQSPQLERAHMGLSLCQALGGQETERQAWLRTLASGPEQATGEWGMAWVALVEGRLDWAEKHMRELLAMGIDGVEPLAGMALLAALRRDGAAHLQWMNQAKAVAAEAPLVRLAAAVWACREQAHASVAHWLSAAQQRL